MKLGTVKTGGSDGANRDRSRGSSCLVEKQMLEIIEHGQATTPYLRFGDHVRIEMMDEKALSIFGAIDQVGQSF